MFRKLNRKTLGVAASLALAGGAICGTAASAQYNEPLGGCWDEISGMCNANWQNWGYMSFSECQTAESCYACPDAASNCQAIGWLDNGDVSRHDGHGH